MCRPHVSVERGSACELALALAAAEGLPGSRVRLGVAGQGFLVLEDGAALCAPVVVGRGVQVERLVDGEVVLAREALGAEGTSVGKV